MKERFTRKISELLIKSFDLRTSIRNDYSFSKRLIKFGVQGFFASIILLAFLLLTDFLARHLFNWLYNSAGNSVACKVAYFFISINDYVGVKSIERLSDLVSIGAGILGVLLGLFYTAFLTIVATKYANINSVARFYLLEDKVINKYFSFLASVTSLAILFQITLIIGYKPTIINCLFFSLLIMIAIASFIRYGKFSLIYFDTSHIANNIIQDCYRTCKKIILYKNQMNNLHNGRIFISKIYRSIDDVLTITRESRNPQTANTSLDNISSDLLIFSEYFNSIKYIIPSDKEWHIQVYKRKSWENARDMDFNLLESTGVDIMPDTVNAYNSIEKKIIDTQFEIFSLHINNSETIDQLQNQSRFLQVIAFHCDYELFEYFFERLEKLLLDKIRISGDLIFRLQLISLYNHLLISYLVGFNHNLRVHKIASLKKLAKAIHNSENTDKIMTCPYFIRVWADSYQEKLRKEIFLEQKMITPLFYTELELAWNIQRELQEHWRKIFEFSRKHISKFSEKLIAENFKIEALQLNLDSFELQKKFNFFIKEASGKINELNEINFQKDRLLVFDKIEEILGSNNHFGNEIMSKVWEIGAVAYRLEEKELPDMFGNYYNRILNDIVNKLLSDNVDEKLLSKQISKFSLSCLLYIDSMREKYKNETPEFFASKIYPLIMDLFEVNAIAFIISKALLKGEIINSIYQFWDNLHKKLNDEMNFWKGLLAIYDYYAQPMLGLSTNSYIKEHNRKMKFGNYLKTSGIVRKEIYSPGKSFIEHFVTDSDDLYVRAVAREMYGDAFNSIDLDEIFIELFLRNRIALKDLKIKQTRGYGGQLERIMDEKKA